MTAKRFEVYYDEYMENWKVQDIITLQIIPCISESVAKELGKKLNEQHETIEQLKQQMLNLEEDLDYFKAKASSLEEGYIQLQDSKIRLEKENEQLKSEIREVRGTYEELWMRL